MAEKTIVHSKVTTSDGYVFYTDGDSDHLMQAFINKTAFTHVLKFPDIDKEIARQVYIVSIDQTIERP